MIQFEPTVSIAKTSPSQYKNFSCGVSELDEYLKRYAKNNEKKGIGKTFVLLFPNNAVIGYYTLSAAQLSITDIPQAYKLKLPAYPIPASRLYRLAVDAAYQGQKIGEHLLAEAIERVLSAATNIAIHALIVDAKNEKAKNFYLKYGFMPLNKNELSLFLPLDTLANT